MLDSIIPRMLDASGGGWYPGWIMASSSTLNPYSSAQASNGAESSSSTTANSCSRSMAAASPG